MVILRCFVRGFACRILEFTLWGSTGFSKTKNKPLGAFGHRPCAKIVRGPLEGLYTDSFESVRVGDAEMGAEMGARIDRAITAII